MSKGKLVGIMHKKGNFTNEKTGEVVDYNNIELVILSPIQCGGKFQPLHALGFQPDKNCKLPAENLTEVFGEQYTNFDSLSDLIGHQIEYFFDSSKKICKVIDNGK